MYTTLKIGIIGAIIVIVIALFATPMQSEIEVESGDPAAKYCLENGGLPFTQVSESIDGNTMEENFCEFPDGTSCPLMGYYEGMCQPGT